MSSASFSFISSASILSPGRKSYFGFLVGLRREDVAGFSGPLSLRTTAVVCAAYLVSIMAGHLTPPLDRFEFGLPGLSIVPDPLGLVHAAFDDDGNIKDDRFRMSNSFCFSLSRYNLASFFFFFDVE